MRSPYDSRTPRRTHCIAAAPGRGGVRPVPARAAEVGHAGDSTIERGGGAAQPGDRARLIVCAGVERTGGCSRRARLALPGVAGQRTAGALCGATRAGAGAGARGSVGLARRARARLRPRLAFRGAGAAPRGRAEAVVCVRAPLAERRASPQRSGERSARVEPARARARSGLPPGAGRRSSQ